MEQNIKAAERFLLALDEDTDSYCFQTFDDSDKKKKELARTLHGTLEKHWDLLVALNNKGAGIFVAINAVDTGKRRRLEHVTRVRALFADHDQPIEALPIYPLEPCLVVQSSPGKKHAYWLAEDVPLADFADLQRAVAACGGSDPVVNDLTRVMRLPGFYHRKREPFLVAIEAYDRPFPYPGAVLRERFMPFLPAADEPRAPGPATPNAPGAEPSAAVLKIVFDAVRRTHQEPTASRHQEIVRMAHILRRDGIALTDAVAGLVLDTFAEHMRPTNSVGVAATMDKAAELRTLRDVYGRPSVPDRERPPRPATTPQEQPPPYGDISPPADTTTDQESPQGGERPVVQVVAGDLHLTVDRAEGVLLDNKSDIYQHGNRLVRIGSWEGSPGDVSRPIGSGVLIDLSPEWLVEHLTRVSGWERWDSRAGDFISIDAPAKIAKTLLARIGAWRFPHLTGFCDSPTLIPGGRIVSKSGYDAESGLYLSNPPKIKAIRGAPLAAAKKAADGLYELVSTFPFVDHGSRSATLAAMMTVLIRRVLPAAPLLCVSASTPGTGKSLLIDCMAALATGKKASVTAVGRDGEELEKRLDSMLLKGDALCSFDNVDRPIKSDVLCQVTTQQFKTVRALGTSKIVEAPTNVALMMTGNNLTLIGDITRRTVMIHLDAGHERPEQIKHSRDAIGHILRFREEGIRNALLISKAYIDAGCPELDCVPFGSFEQWDRMIRRPLIWAGWEDPLAPAESLRAQDHDLQGMIDLYNAWEAEIGLDEITAAEIREMVTARVEKISGGYIPEFPKIQDAAVTVLGNVNKWGARELGYKLRTWQGRIVNGRKVVNCGKKQTGVHWRLEKLGDE